MVTDRCLVHTLSFVMNRVWVAGLSIIFRQVLLTHTANYYVTETQDEFTEDQALQTIPGISKIIAISI